MRPIKFRGHRLNNGEPTTEWTYGSLRCDYGGVDTSSVFCRDKSPELYSVGIRACSIYDPNTHEICAVDAATVGQYTGLHDVRGTEIYEGDIVTAGKHTGEVKWMPGKCCFQISPGGVFLSARCEVIGKIHDQPQEGAPDGR